jgi:SAM-dependent methyltransferase
MRRCRICEGDRLQTFEARESFMGSGEPFLYAACSDCGTLQIVKIPDLTRLYTPRYYDLHGDGDFSWVSQIVGRDFRAVLDVGCGLGGFLARLDASVARRVGVDPYSCVSSAEAEDQGWELVRTLDDVAGRFDLVTSVHSLEHVPAPHSTLAALRQRLAPSGRLVVAMPLAGSALALQYGRVWGGLEPGRHLHILTESRFRHMAEESGFTIEGSLIATAPGAVAFAEFASATPNPSFTAFSKAPVDAKALARWQGTAAKLTQAGQGDTGVFILARR